MSTIRIPFSLGRYSEANYECNLSDTDIVNPDEFFCSQSGDLHIVLDHGFVVGAAFADNEQDAWDELADKHKLKDYLVSPEDEDESEYYVCLGNHSRMYDTDALTMVIVPIDYSKMNGAICDTIKAMLSEPLVN
jgi:hypothetical protein